MASVESPPPEAGAPMRVEVVYCADALRQDVTVVELAAGATVADALRASGVLTRHPALGEPPLLGIWGRRQPPEAPLRQGDRVELYRPLTVDPKEARRLRYKRDRRGKGAGGATGL